MIRCSKENQATSVKVKSTYACVLKSLCLLEITQIEKPKPIREKPLSISYDGYLQSVREQLDGPE